jgi:polyhydroxybutyrate depolymerase
MLSQKLGMEATDRFAAIAEVASSLPLSQMALNKKPSKPIPVLMINGTNDPAFPWAGGNTSIIGIKVGPVASVMKSAQYWINVNGGMISTPDEQLVVSDKKGKTTVDRTHFSTKMNMPVILYKINGRGRTWPGSDIPLLTEPHGRCHTKLEFQDISTIQRVGSKSTIKISSSKSKKRCIKAV